MIYKLFRNFSARGMSLVEALVGLVILVMILGAFISWLLSNQKQVKQDSTITGLRFAMTSFLSNMKSEMAWSNTLADHANTSMDCIKNTTSCNNVSQNFSPRDPSNTLLFDSSLTTTGFDLSGQRCLSSCPIIASSSWEPVCLAGAASCVPKQIIIQLNLSLSPQLQKSIGTLNAGRLSFRIYKNL